MVGGGIRRDDAAPRISSTNVFAALETLKKKKKSSDKDSKGLSKSKRSAKAQEKQPEPSEVYWVPTPLNKSWADVDDDDDDYYKSAPVLPGWGSAEPKQNKDSGAPLEEESESEDDGLVDGDDDIEDEAEQEAEPPISAEPVEKNLPPVPVATKDPERQLSKKEQKKKELEELDALLAEFGVSNKNDKGAVQLDNNAAAATEPEEQTVDGDNEVAAAPLESKTSKKKKVKKEKSKESKDTQEPAGDAEASATEATTEEPVAVVDVKEKLKKVVSTKKKKPGKEMDAGAKIAASEAAARSAKLAAAKKKEKNHYNQQPVR